MSIEILSLEPDRHAAVLKLNESCLPHVNRIDDNLLRWFVAHGWVRTVLEDDVLVAFLVGLRPGTSYASSFYGWFCDRYEDFAYVDRICVANDRRQRGLGELLYSAFEKSQSDAPRMTCEVNLQPANPGSFKFHERLGFRQVGTGTSDDGSKTVAFLERSL